MNKVKLAVGVAVGVGLLSLPLAAHAATGTTNVSANVAGSITLATSPTVALGVTPTVAGVMSSASGTATVNTNDPAGYNLTLASSTTATTLDNGSGGTVAASAGTFGAPIALAGNAWGYRVDGVGGFGAGPTTAETNAVGSTTKFAGVPASTSPATIATTAAVANNAVTTVWYGLSANTGLAEGTYARQVTYTAIVNP